MNIILLILLGFIGGVAGGMGLGGGTILIPLLSIFLHIVQKEAQFLNVFSFIIMATFIIFFHIKNKLVEVFPALIFSIFGVLSSLVASLFVKNISNNVLKIYFGLFLLLLAFIQIISLISNKKQKK